jgi:hypothetical protein
MYNVRGQEITFKCSRTMDKSHSHNKRHQMATIETSKIRTVMKPGPSQALVSEASSPGVLVVRRIRYVNSTPLCVINT